MGEAHEDIPAGDKISTFRILDANFNRAFEAFRVIEDNVRFACDNILVNETIKELRHGLKASAIAVGREMIIYRDVVSDVGRDFTTEDEDRREDVVDIMFSNFGRLKEALRVLEENTKLVLPEAASAIKRIRYQVYNLEKRIFQMVRPKPLLEHARLCVIVTSELAGGNPLSVVRDAIAGGAEMIQLREKEMEGAEFLKLARGFREITSEAGVLFIVNDRVDAALLSHADGVHLGYHDMSTTDARKLLGVESIIGRTAHSVDEAISAVADGADYIAVGAVFESFTKPDVEVSGLTLAGEAAEKIRYPLFAVGGITAKNVEKVVKAGVQRVAVCASVVKAKSPKAATEKIRKHLPPKPAAD